MSNASPPISEADEREREAKETAVGDSAVAVGIQSNGKYLFFFILDTWAPSHSVRRSRTPGGRSSGSGRPGLYPLQTHNAPRLSFCQILQFEGPLCSQV